MERPIVSIVIPSYNSSEFIIETLDSIVNQTFKNFEVIAVNDGSTDDSVEKIINHSQNVQLISIPNNGVSNARNIGFNSASGEFILFLDADDILQPNFLQNKVQLIQQNTCDVVAGNVIDYVNGEAKTIRKSFTENFEENIVLYHPELNTCPSGYLIRLSKLKAKNVCFDTRLSCSADRHFLLQLIKNGFSFQFVSDNNDSLLYRIHETSMSNKISNKLAEDLAKYFQILKNEDLIENGSLKKSLLSKNNIILSGIQYQLKHPLNAIKYLLMAFLNSPKIVFKYCLNKLK